MTCYFRHMSDVFGKAGVTVTKENKKDVDRVIHSIVGVEYKNCPATWKEVKKRMAEDEESFVNTLKSKLTKN
jgi:hypothetical protein